MSPTSADVVRKALAAATAEDAAEVQTMIQHALGGRYLRPLGDTWNNHGLMGSSGSFDLKLIENVTNMQDAVIERFALAEHGSTDAVPYKSPHEAAARFFTGLDSRLLADKATVTFRESDRPTSRSKRLTAVFRDQGCGMIPSIVPRTIFRLGGSHKEDALYLQGAFGLGGAMTYRNAKAVVLVTRRAPELLTGDQEDCITVAVVQWRENTKGSTAFYLVDRPWQEPGDIAEPWSCPAADYPEFEPGTHLALISYRVEGFHRRREGDERAFDVVTNTRLCNPVLPVRFRNEIVRADRSTVLRGLFNRLDNAERDFNNGEETLPFHHEGMTYLLPVRYTLFEKPREAGGRDKFVAHDHAVLFTSNGQVHHHWSPNEFRNRTTLNKLYDRILVIVETDELPIRLRTSLFTADRNDLVRGDAALRLEEAVAGFINDWYALREENNTLLRESLKGGSDQPTADIARRISRVLNVKGFSTTGGSGDGGGGGAGRPGRAGGGGASSKPIDLHNDPTRISGPAVVQAETGRTRAVTYTVDVVDSFYEGRGQLRVTCDHPDLEEGREITVGKGRSGRVRIMIAVPDTAELGTYEMRVTLTDWIRAAGGLGTVLEHVTKLQLVPDIPGKGVGTGKATTGKDGNAGPGQGGSVALRWSNPEAQEDWDRITVGGIEEIPAQMLAETQPEYEELKSLGDTPIPTIVLNDEYPPYKKYLSSRSESLISLERPKEQYAVGVGVALLLIQQELDEGKKQGKPLPDDAFVEEMRRAAARGVLAVMPSFDDLAKQAGLDES